MSRIGKLPISIPNGVNVTIEKENLVKVKGPKGELSQKVDPEMIVEIDNGTIEVKRPSDQKRHRAMHGLYRTLINNMVTGVSEGYTKVLEVVGVGYKAEVKGGLLELTVGYSHPIVMALPPEVKAEAVSERGKPPVITLKSHDKQLIGQIAAKIRSFRPPEPYKGKGIRFQGEQIRRKEGKAAGKK
ncbi:MAG: 50S ribosomal protein L6 [Bacteroidia bacterium]|nr:50S ribosomal protein L6 [Bacteroidia bacterium]